MKPPCLLLPNEKSKSVSNFPYYKARLGQNLKHLKSIEDASIQIQATNKIKPIWNSRTNAF